MAHGVVHFEIGGPDDRQLAEFYADLFGWSMTAVPDAGYTLVDTRGGAGINGGIGLRPDGTPSVTFYIETDDLQAVLDKINLLGGKTETAITEIPGIVSFAKFCDLDGNVVGLAQGPSEPAQGGLAHSGLVGLAGPQRPTAGDGAPVDWFELLGTDADRSQRFYTEIFGWQTTSAGPGYRMVDTGSARGIRGGIGVGQQGAWATFYASVADVGAVLDRAVELGGARVYGPDPVDDHMQTGALRDPAGNVVGVYHHAPHD